MARRSRTGGLGYTPLEARDDTWYEAAARRTNAATARRLPLLAWAGLAPTVTGAERRTRDELARARSEQGMAELTAHHAALARDRRDDVATKVSSELLVALDAAVACRSYLADPTRLADHWLQIQRRVDLGLDPFREPDAAGWKLILERETTSPGRREEVPHADHSGR